MSSFLSHVSETAPQQALFCKAQPKVNVVLLWRTLRSKGTSDASSEPDRSVSFACSLVHLLLLRAVWMQQQRCGLGKGVPPLRGNVASSFSLGICLHWLSLFCLFTATFFFFFQLMIQIWHGESGWSSRELIRGFSCQNLTPNTWSLILNLGRDLYHGRCWSLWLEAVERVHIGDLTLSLWPLWAWLLLVLQPPGELDPLERSSGSASCCPACESQAFAQLQSTWPCASRSFGG